LALDFAAHRAELLEQLGDDEAVLLIANAVSTRSNDTEFRYRPSSDIFWLTGFEHPECAVFLRRGDVKLTMFVQPRDRAAETWNGRRPGVDGAKTTFGADEAFPINDLESELVRLLQGVRRLHYAFAEHPEADQLLSRAIYRAGRAARRNGLSVPTELVSPKGMLHELRLRKREHELDAMRQAAALSAQAHVLAMKAGSPGTFEYEIESTIEHHIRKNGGRGMGYTSIIAAGDNANILHYIENDAMVKDGDLVLVDAGGEVDYYTADITRTWPANGRFTAAQAKVYQAVLNAQLASIAEVKPGSSLARVHDTSVRKLTEAMVELGLLEGEVDELIRSEAFKRYYMHGTSHWLGLDVHDVGNYFVDGQSRPLEPGMILTIEPGIYIPEDDESAPEELRGIGVRIEDDILVTAAGYENLTAACPKTIPEVEAACARG